MGDHNYSNMNMYERAAAICYLLARDGYYCNVCKISIKELIRSAKIKEEITSKPRKNPLLLVENITNNGYHRVDIYNEDLMSNYQLSCYPCNRVKNLHKPDLSLATGPESSREKRDNSHYKPTYHRNLKTFLLDNEHGCQAEIYMNSEELSDGGNKVTVMRYFEAKLYTNTNKKGIYQIFSHTCESSHCNHNHICLVGTKPTKLLEQERQRLESKWYVEYGDKRDKFSSHTAYSNITFIELDEYMQTHCELLSHNFK